EGHARLFYGVDPVAKVGGFPGNADRDVVQSGDDAADTGNLTDILETNGVLVAEPSECESHESIRTGASVCHRPDGRGGKPFWADRMRVRKPSPAHRRNRVRVSRPGLRASSPRPGGTGRDERESNRTPGCHR